MREWSDRIAKTARMVRVRIVCGSCVRTPFLVPSLSRSHRVTVRAGQAFSRLNDQLDSIRTSAFGRKWGPVMIVTSYTRFVMESHRQDCARLANQAGRWLRGRRAVDGRVDAYRIESLELAPALTVVPRRGVLTDVPVTKTAEIRGTA